MRFPPPAKLPFQLARRTGTAPGMRPARHSPHELVTLTLCLAPHGDIEVGDLRAGRPTASALSPVNRMGSRRVSAVTLATVARARSEAIGKTKDTHRVAIDEAGDRGPARRLQLGGGDACLHRVVSVGALEECTASPRWAPSARRTR